MALIEAQARVRQLESAIDRLSSVKKHLNSNAADIQNDIRTSISRNLEWLQGREVSLCDQVSRILKMKEESLHRQQLRLGQALTVLKTGVALVKDEAAPEGQLADTLERLKQIDLSPEETPYISFRVDHLQLRDSIHQYGRVDANGLPLMTAFDDPGNPSASLPRQVEEYEDAEHHVFYKPVGQGRMDTESSINVAIPKLSNRVEDWLQKKRPVSVTPTEVKCHRPALRPNQLWAGLLEGAPSGSSTPGSSCSLTNWLTSIKQHADLEEEHDFEIVDNSDRGVCRSVAAVSSGVKDSDFFAHIDKNMDSWLKPAAAVDIKMDFDICGHIPQDTQVWLSQAYRQLTSLEVLPKDFFSHVSRDPASWLRCRAYNRQTQAHGDGLYSKANSPSTDKWLLKQKPCVASPATLPARASPLAQPVGTSRPAPSTVDSESEKWLLKREPDMCWLRPNVPDKPVFAHLKPLCDPSWLRQESKENLATLQSSKPGPNSGWLLQESTESGTSQESTESGTSQESFVPFCVADWLVVRKPEDESDGWSVCSSSSHSATTEQFSRQVAVEYYNKWLL